MTKKKGCKWQLNSGSWTATYTQKARSRIPAFLPLISLWVPTGVVPRIAVPQRLLFLGAEVYGGWRWAQPRKHARHDDLGGTGAGTGGGLSSTGRSSWVNTSTVHLRLCSSCHFQRFVVHDEIRIHWSRIEVDPMLWKVRRGIGLTRLVLRGQ